ncbi:MAG: sulfotransferase domain-containing protein [Bryobacteraceae bacterium]|jgi:LPS sulfotransferase NodH
MRDYVTVVSGAPRSGTSLMMRMLAAGGIPALTDGRRPPDAHNPHGYFEYSPAKRLAEDASWIEAARGRAVKIIYRLLTHLPPRMSCRIIFMERDLEEVFASQRDMLLAQGNAAASQEGDHLIPAMAAELRVVRDWLARQPGMPVLAVPYAEVVRDPLAWAHEVAHFLGAGLDEAAMAAAVDPSLYRHRGSGMP